jgi:3-hydroxyisobutyrate dehydrogenase-like beta-hydroxyacid dehydrogenase
VNSLNIGILHPGEMGVSVAASAKNGGHTLYWVSEGRSPQTCERAERLGFVDAVSLSNLCKTCAIIISVCPPASAEEVAHQVLSYDFAGYYVDANAISPQRAVRIGEAMQSAGVTFVDGGIIGGPAWKLNSTWLYLSGIEADEVASCFSAGPLETCVVGETIGKASALKMCFAAYSKGTTALLCAVLAAAEALNVRDELEQHWSRDGSRFAEEASQKVRQVTAKAWRFVGEMEEIAATLHQSGMPDKFHLAAAEIYRRMEEFRGASTTPSLEDVLAALITD